MMDLYSRRIIGWSMQASMISQLVTDVLIMALRRRDRPCEVLHHSDQGIDLTAPSLYECL